MKVLGISGSPRKGGNTDILVKEALKSAEENGADTEFVGLAGKEIKGCIACSDCGKKAKCVIDDDMQEIYPKMVAADAIVLGSPVYFGTVTAQTKALIDRSYFLHKNGRKLAGKVGGAIAVGGRAGHEISSMTIMDFATIVGMVLPGNAFVHSYSREKGAASDEENAMTGASSLGERIVGLHNTLTGRMSSDEMP